eukprot:SAG31_NODE_14806_length_786_cov_1.871907_1_plen_77_part_00
MRVPSAYAAHEGYPRPGVAMKRRRLSAMAAHLQPVAADELPLRDLSLAPSDPTASFSGCTLDAAAFVRERYIGADE